jgi:hypothetical protein
MYRRKDNLYHHLKENHQSGTGLQNQPVDINHSDQYFTITKEKWKKMPRFNTESNEYRVTFNELNVQTVPDILKTLQNLFDSVLTDVTKGMQEEDLVQVTLECPLWCLFRRWCSINWLFLAKVCWQYPQECICKRQMYSYLQHESNSSTTCQIHFIC